MMILLWIIGLSLLIFVLTHLRPLTDEETRSLASKRRSARIREYFSFDRRERNANPDFKKQMNPSGAFYRINESLSEFPSIAAALLKYKKHEWLVIGFEKDRQVELMWVNKGSDRSKVTIPLTAEAIVSIARRENLNSVLIFHNHPNPSPNHLDCTNPSDADKKSAAAYAKMLNQSGINLVEFVCERGRYYRYFVSISDDFLPLISFVVEIMEVNGKSRLKNLSLHLERIF